MLLITIGSLNTVPSNIFLIVPLGDFHIYFKLNSFTLALSGVIVAHLTPTLCFNIAFEQSIVTWSFVASRFWIERSKYSVFKSTYGKMCWNKAINKCSLYFFFNPFPNYFCHLITVNIYNFFRYLHFLEARKWPLLDFAKHF